MDFTQNIEGLIERAQKGDSDAFGEIFDLYLTPIYRFIYFRISNKEDAEDLTEEVFMKAWEKINTFKKMSNIPFSAWLFQIAKNIVTDFWRKNKDTLEIDENHEDKKSFKELVQNTEVNFERKRLKKALNEIPSVQADAISLKFFSELSNQEIATVLKKSEGAVRILLSRGLKRLREIMDQK
jgi:RNA polymerase sigma-70 factor (ECF subfamily)